MLNELIKLANELDKKGLRKEADYLDSLLRKTAGARVSFPVEKKHPNPKVVDLGNAKLDSPMSIFNVFGSVFKNARPLGAAHFGVDEDKIKVELPQALYDVKYKGRASPLESTIMFTDTQGNSKPWSDPMWDRIVGKSSKKYRGADGRWLDGLPYFASQEGLIVSVSGVKAKVWPKEETGHPSWTDPNWGPEQND